VVECQRGRSGPPIAKVSPLALHVHHGPHLGPLVEILAGTLAAPVADPFAADVISVPTAGMRDWLLQQLGLRLGSTGHNDGIASNIDMVFPGRFNAAALGRPLDSTSPWDIERLTWTVLEALESGAVDVPGWHGRGARHGTYATARRIADLFDRYAINRPQILQQWHAGHDGDGTTDDNGAVVPVSADHAWQAPLWRLVRTMVGQPNPAEQLPHLLAEVRAGRIDVRLPERVAVFGISGVSAAQIDLLHALGSVRDVNLFLTHASPAAWDACRHRLAGRLVLRSNCDASAAVVNPLFRSWGRPSMETAALIGGLDAELHSATSRRDESPTLLRQLQADIVTDTASVADSVVREDDTIQVHACHGAVRQVEVLRDALGHVFAGDDTLLAHDVVVLCPDLLRFAPLVQSVFLRSSLPIPVRVTDLSLGSGNPVATALSTILEVIGGRCTGPEVLGVCSLEPVRRAFDFDDESIERIDRWMTDLGVTWGLDGEHRGRWIADDIAEGTWASTLDRILLGAAMPAPVARVGSDGIVPFDDVDAAALVTAGQVADLVDRLASIRRISLESHPIDEWIVVLTRVVNELLATPPTEDWQMIQVMETIAEIGRHASTVAVPLALNDVRSLLSSVLGQQRGRLNLRSGAVTVTAMVPVRNIPARVICILGLDEGTLRPAGGDGDDLLVARPCVGEREARAEGRHLLLDALMAAGEHLIITCDGSDITTNRRLPLPILVEELLGVVRTCRPSLDIVRRHPRQAYDERNFAAIPFSFDAGMLAAADGRRVAAKAGDAPTTLPLLTEVHPSTVTIAQLADSVTRPARTYLVQRLDVRLPRPVEEIDTDIPLVLDPLDSWQLAQELLDHFRRGNADELLQPWRDAKRRGGSLPPRALADAVIDDVEVGLAQLLDARPNVRSLIRADGTMDVDLEVSAPDLDAAPVRLAAVIERIADDLLVRVEFSRPKNRHHITAALELAALVVTDPDRDWRALLISRAKSGGTKPTVIDLVPVSGADRVDAARRFLQAALAIHLRALREPVPLFDKSSRILFDTGNYEDEDLESDMRDNHTGFMWGEATSDEILAIPVSDDDITEVTDIAATTRCTGGGRAHAYARYFWTAYEDFVGGADDADDDAGETA
jgi:exodeoxyribonuclease V gamma subunit